MRKAILVTSVIAPEMELPLNLGNRRSAFTIRERLIQTVSTLHSLTIQQGDAQIYFCDASEPDYSEFFDQYYPNVKYLHLQATDPTLAAEVRTVANKSIGEAHMVLSLWDVYRKELLEADFIIKATGRYFYENLHNEYFTAENLDKFLFTYHSTDQRPWIDHEGFDWSLAKNLLNPTEYRHVLRTTLYGFGRKQTLRYFKAVKELMFKLYRPQYTLYDVENLLACELGYELASNQFVRVNWQYLGWNSVSGEFIKI